MTPQDMTTFLDESGHVPAADMARYIDGASDRVTRSRVTHHLADCEECREELTALRRLVPPRSRMTTRAGVILGAAAAVMLITLSWRGSLTSRVEESSPDRTRAQGGIAEIDAPLAVVAPSMGAIVSADNLRLIWRAAGTDAAYRVMIFDDAGGSVFSMISSDTSMGIPPATLVEQDAAGSQRRARTFFWSVEARLLDGRSAKTGLTQFRIR